MIGFSHQDIDDAMRARREAGDRSAILWHELLQHARFHALVHSGMPGYLQAVFTAHDVADAGGSADEVLRRLFFAD